jgi:hypothetical protein
MEPALFVSGGLGLVEIGLARDKVVLDAGELTGNIWGIRLPND